MYGYISDPNGWIDPLGLCTTGSKDTGSTKKVPSNSTAKTPAKGTGGEKTKDIYRAVSPEEYDDIMNTKSFRQKPDGRSLAAKEFGNDFNETLNFANKSINSDKAAIIKVTIPESMYNKLNHMQLDKPIFKSGTPVVEPEILNDFNESILRIQHIY